MVQMLILCACSRDHIFAKCYCSDTVSRSAIFCAIATTIERCKTEGVVDVFQVVKAMRMQRPGAIQTIVCSNLIASVTVCVCVCVCVCARVCDVSLEHYNDWCSLSVCLCRNSTSPFMKLCWSSLTPLKPTQISCNSLLLIITTKCTLFILDSCIRHL